MRKTVLLSCLTGACVAAVSATYAVEVTLQVTETSQTARMPGIITMGVPFARGAVRDVSRLTVSLGGKPVPAQFTQTAPWDDGSVRWALMDTQAAVPAGGTVELTVSDRGGNPAPAAPVTIKDAADAVTVNTGPLAFVVSKTRPGLFQSLSVDGKDLLTGAGRGLVVVTEDEREVVAAPPTAVTVEQAGPMRAVVCLKGTFPGLHKGLLAYTVRVAAFAGRKAVRVHAWLENHGSIGYYKPKTDRDYWSGVSSTCEWFRFSGMHVELGLGLGGTVTARCESAKADGDLKVLQVCKLAKTLPARGDPPPPYFTWDNFEYTVTSGGKELARGDRTDGVVTLAGEKGRLVTAIRDFWQNYEKAIELNGDRLRLWLWPAEGQWPRAQTRRTQNKYINGVLTKSGLSMDGHRYYLQGGVHKGHEIILDFGGHDAKAVGTELSAPLPALASADYYASTGAAPGVFAPPDVRTGRTFCDRKLDAWMRMARGMVDPANPYGFIKSRQEVPVKRAANFRPEEMYWFGWMDYGDIPVPGHGSVSLHYDWTWIALVNALRTGDAAFMRLGTAMARHRIDIDQLWSDRDPVAFRGLQRPDQNAPPTHINGRFSAYPTPTTNWLPGVVLYYMLTGEPKALACCRRNAEGLRAVWAWTNKTRPWAGAQGNMAANAWSMDAYCAMYDLTADKAWRDDALGLFRTNVTPMWKAEGPFLHDPDHQIRGQTYMKEDVKYCYSIASFCNLHRHTGDEEVFKLLAEGCEKEFPDTFFESPKFLSDLYAYVGHKTGNAAYVKQAADLFAQGFPASKNPPIILPGSSTWSRTAAMTLRTGHWLQYANWKLKSGTKPEGRAP